MNTFLIIIAVIAVGWVLLILGLKAMAVLLRKSTVKAARSVLAGEDILKISDNASFLGADFTGPNLPPRTSGVLAITATRLIFLPWFPRRMITLPGDSIAKVRLLDNFGEMAFNIPVLSMVVKGVGDPHGNIAWLTYEPEEWERKIKSILR